MSELFGHPIHEKPYFLLEFVRHDGNGVPLYTVKGSTKTARGAYEALGEAFALAGGSCFYCKKRFKPQRLDKRIAHRDHVVPSSRDGPDHLHNLVIACLHCGSAKSGDDIFDFRPAAAKRYQKALSDHLSACVKAAPSGSSPTP